AAIATDHVTQVALPAASSFDQPSDDQKDHGAHCGGDYLSNDARTEMNSECGEQQAGEQGTDNSDHDVADQSKTGSLHDQACEPAGDRADQQDDNQAFSCETHSTTLPILM